MPDPTLILVTTTAALPREGEVAGERHKRDLEMVRATAASIQPTIDMLTSRVAERDATISELRREAEASEETFRWASETEAEVQKGISDLKAELTKRDETIADLEAKFLGTMELLEVAEEGRDKATTELALVRNVNAQLDGENTSLAELLASLRSQLAWAAAIEAKALNVLKHANREDDYTNTIDAAYLDELEDVLSRTARGIRLIAEHEQGESFAAASPGPEVAKPAEAPVIDAAARLAILERVAKTAKDFFRGRSEDPTDDVYTLFRLAVADLIASEEAL